MSMIGRPAHPFTGHPTDTETFGPLAQVFRFETEAEAIAMANDTEFGLASYLQTRDHSCLALERFQFIEQPQKRLQLFLSKTSPPPSLPAAPALAVDPAPLCDVHPFRPPPCASTPRSCSV